MFKVKNKDIRRRRYSGVVIANFKHIWHFFLVILFLTLNMYSFAGIRSNKE